MRKSTILLTAAVALAGATAVMAQNAPAPDMSKGAGRPEHMRMAPDPQRAKEFCADRYAHDVGRFAYLEAKLDLNATQKPLFQKWQQSVLNGAAKDRDTCVANAANVGKGDVKRTALDHESRMETMLSTKLETLKASRPALEALYASLTPDQQAKLDRPFGGARHGMDHGHGGPDRDHRPGRL
jgi:hypothetical protein